MRAHTTTLAALAAALLAAAPADAQILAMQSGPPQTADAQTAQRLHDEADRLGRERAALSRMSRRDLRRMAELHVRSAELRPADDPRAVGCLRAAANLLHGFHPARAAELLEQAGDRALARGDVLTAARSYLDLAAVQQARRGSGSEQQARLQARALEFGRKAALLLNSPLLSEADRAELRARIQEQSTTPRLATR